jgi:hypothetical protein
MSELGAAGRTPRELKIRWSSVPLNQFGVAEMLANNVAMEHDKARFLFSKTEWVPSHSTLRPRHRLAKFPYWSGPSLLRELALR